MTPSSQELEPPGIPGRFNTASLSLQAKGRCPARGRGLETEHGSAGTRRLTEATENTDRIQAGTGRIATGHVCIGSRAIDRVGIGGPRIVPADENACARVTGSDRATGINRGKDAGPARRRATRTCQRQRGCGQPRSTPRVNAAAGHDSTRVQFQDHLCVSNDCVPAIAVWRLHSFPLRVRQWELSINRPIGNELSECLFFYIIKT